MSCCFLYPIYVVLGLNSPNNDKIVFITYTWYTSFWLGLGYKLVGLLGEFVTKHH